MPRIRPYRPSDLPRLREITVEAFNGVSMDQNAEQVFGLIHGHDWQWRKARHVDEDVARDAAGVFVVVEGDEVLGGIMTWIDTEAGIGHIPNLVLTATARGQGLGRQLLQHALAHFRSRGATFAKIETLEQNAIGQKLYTSLGFRETARQIHFMMPLTNSESSDE